MNELNCENVCPAAMAMGTPNCITSLRQPLTAFRMLIFTQS